MFKIELENRDFRKSLYFYMVDAEKKKKKKKKRAASGCWHYIKSKANIKWTLEKIWATSVDAGKKKRKIGCQGAGSGR